ncbi:putative transcription factor interactor and regulator CCHC(Zn) family [Rosa chinensis]|uniref:Putative transcription factor interactor and regulator CCHC(Zn) family n=1 Tax=Rosa chinensis TaxID=74649 RepID=A0A2P6QDS0_ROSCH|nr:uncharacterized protein LOC112167105 [Rosa chinensis]PRQ32332.1 putative transcription factor interactor and regulator CCHC(Zn) family [Rosa chinensis]
MNADKPIPGVDEWEVVERPILPPRYTRGPGRPKLLRNKEPGEQAPPPGTTKLSRSYHQSITCSVCKKDGHNKRTCSRRQQQGNDSQAGVQPSETDVQSVHVEQAENVQSDVQVESDMHYGSVQQTANVPTPSIVASASSQPMISSPPLPQSSLQPTVIGSSHTSRTFVCPKTGKPFKTKSIAHKPKPKLVIGTSTKA